MPGIDGLEVTRRFRADNRCAHDERRCRTSARATPSKPSRAVEQAAKEGDLARAADHLAILELAVKEVEERLEA
jgi:CheY-like chemotaxis protein